MNAIETTLDMNLTEAEASVRDALAAQGFGVLTEIDLAATLKNKIGVERAPLKILGACNPQLAHQALGIDPTASLVIPCNVVLEPAETGGTRVSVVDPRDLMPDPRFSVLAGNASDKLSAALDSLTD